MFENDISSVYDDLTKLVDRINILNPQPPSSLHDNSTRCTIYGHPYSLPRVPRRLYVNFRNPRSNSTNSSSPFARHSNWPTLLYHVPNIPTTINTFGFHQVRYDRSILHVANPGSQPSVPTASKSPLSSLEEYESAS